METYHLIPAQKRLDKTFKNIIKSYLHTLSTVCVNCMWLAMMAVAFPAAFHSYTFNAWLHLCVCMWWVNSSFLSSCSSMYVCMYVFCVLLYTTSKLECQHQAQTTHSVIRATKIICISHDYSPYTNNMQYII